jgi:hypothetical protein
VSQPGRRRERVRKRAREAKAPAFLEGKRLFMGNSLLVRGLL